MSVRWVPTGLPQVAITDRAPTNSDDRSIGARIGADWVWESAGRRWTCQDDTVGAAVWVEMQGAAGAQPLSTKLSALAGLDTVPGAVEQVGPDSFAKRAFGVAASTSILTRGDGDGRYTDDFIDFLPGPVAPYVSRKIRSKLRDVWSLRDFGTTGDGSETDGGRIRSAIETAADDKLTLTIPAAPPGFEGWRLDAPADLNGKSDFALIGQAGAVLSPRGAGNPLWTWTDCHRVRIESLGINGRSSDTETDYVGCTGIEMRAVVQASGRGIRLYDGCARWLIEDCELDEPRGAGIQFGEAGTHPSGDPITDITVRRLRVLGSWQEALEFQNKPQRILIDTSEFLDCNSVGAEEVFDVGGGEAEDITFRDILIDNTGTLSPYSAAILCGVRVKSEYSIRPKRVRMIRFTINMPANAATESFGIFCEADDYEISGGVITGDVGYGLSLGNAGYGRVEGIRLLGQRTYGARIRSTHRGKLRDIYVEPQAGATCVLADSSAWGEVHGEFVGGAQGVRFNTSATDCRASGVFRNQTTVAFRADSAAARAALRNASVSGAAKVAELRGDRQQIVGLTAEGSGSIGVEVVTGANLCSVVGATVQGFTSNLTNNGTGTVTAGNVTA